MFRILIVEDDPPTLELLGKAIARKIDDVHVDAAMNVSEAHEFIDRAINNQPYHAVVLDMMLPSGGLTPSLDETICRKLRDRMPHTLVAHITAYQDNDEVREHLETFHGPSQIDLSFSLSKLVVTYSSELIAKLKGYLYSRRIENQLDALFNGGGVGEYSAGGRPARPRHSSGARSRTHELASLTQNISTDWPYLSVAVKTRIQDIFKVVEDPNGGVRVSLF